MPVVVASIMQQQLNRDVTAYNKLQVTALSCDKYAHFRRNCDVNPKMFSSLEKGWRSLGLKNNLTSRCWALEFRGCRRQRHPSCARNRFFTFHLQNTDVQCLHLHLLPPCVKNGKFSALDTFLCKRSLLVCTLSRIAHNRCCLLLPMAGQQPHHRELT